MEKTNYIGNTDGETVDLRDACKGDVLVSCHGEHLRYVEFIEEYEFPHRVEYSNGLGGSRTHEGWVARNIRLESDHDIVEIIPCDMTKLKRYLKNIRPDNMDESETYHDILCTIKHIEEGRQPL